MKSNASAAGAKPINKEEQIEQLEFFTKWLKENGLNPRIWTLIKENEKMLIGSNE